MFLLPIITDRAWAIWTKTLLGPSHSGSLMNVSENAELRSDALLHFKQKILRLNKLTGCTPQVLQAFPSPFI